MQRAVYFSALPTFTSETLPYYTACLHEAILSILHLSILLLVSRPSGEVLLSFRVMRDAPFSVGRWYRTHPSKSGLGVCSFLLSFSYINFWKLFTKKALVPLLYCCSVPAVCSTQKHLGNWTNWFNPNQSFFYSTKKISFFAFHNHALMQETPPGLTICKSWYAFAEKMINLLQRVVYFSPLPTITSQTLPYYTA